MAGFCISAVSGFDIPPVLALAANGRPQSLAEQRGRISELVVAIQSGDVLAEAALVRSLEGPLLATAIRMVRDVATAEDIFIQAMTRLLNRIHDVREPEAFAAYARRTLCTVALDVLRSRSVRDSRRALRDTAAMESAGPEGGGAVVDRLGADEPDAEAALIESERRQEVRDAVEGLSEPGRTMIRMFFERGMTYAQIAEATGTPRRTAMRRVGAARLLLAARLRGLDEELA